MNLQNEKRRIEQENFDLISENNKLIAKIRILESNIYILNSKKQKDERFSALKKIVARELHPDSDRVSNSERIIREELFKKIWSEIEKIEK